MLVVCVCVMIKKVSFCKLLKNRNKIFLACLFQGMARLVEVDLSFDIV